MDESPTRKCVRLDAAPIAQTPPKDRPTHVPTPDYDQAKKRREVQVLYHCCSLTFCRGNNLLITQGQLQISIPLGQDDVQPEFSFSNSNGQVPGSVQFSNVLATPSTPLAPTSMPLNAAAAFPNSNPQFQLLCPMNMTQFHNASFNQLPTATSQQPPNIFMNPGPQMPSTPINVFPGYTAQHVATHSYPVVVSSFPQMSQYFRGFFFG